jgi:hypothetical protein
MNIGLGPNPYYHVMITTCSPNPTAATIIDVSGSITTNAPPLDYLIVIALKEGQTTVGQAVAIAHVPGSSKLPLYTKSTASWKTVGETSGVTGGVVTCELLNGPAGSQLIGNSGNTP